MVVKDKKITCYVLTLTSYYVLWAQFKLILPLTITSVIGSPSYVKWMHYAIQAGILTYTALPTRSLD
ncbi:hypothetical protein [Gilliamella sp. App4-10]|nr:hypothetical protein [Gilliamella apicola]OCG21234.1 hypothetical protein A9G23_05060 [Gilliamella apicola]OCG24907.1 hypothetical protein A9G22_03495 [Gilliamella apicola]